MLASTTADRGTVDRVHPVPSAPLEKGVIVIDSAVSDGDNNNVDSSPPALLVPLVNTERYQALPTSYDARNGRSKGSSTGHISNKRPGLDAAAAHRPAPDSPRWPRMAGQGTG